LNSLNGLSGLNHSEQSRLGLREAFGHHNPPKKSQKRQHQNQQHDRPVIAATRYPPTFRSVDSGLKALLFFFD
jgi:hypothetical protein